MKHPPIALSLFLLVFAAVGVAFAQEGAVDKTPRPVPRIDSKINIDGSLDEEAWSGALLIELPFETQPGENVPACVKTEVLVMYDSGSVYFGFSCYDPDPSAIRAHYADRDGFYGDDLVNINLDTFNDERRNYFLGANAFGIQRDGIETPSYTDQSWDAIFDSAGRITGEGYTLEFKIPFACLQFQRTDGPQVWGLDISRWYPRSVSRRLGLVPIDRSNNSYQSQFMKIVGFEGIEPGRDIELNPTITAIRTDIKDEPTDRDFAINEDKTDLGLTASWGVTANFNAVAAINPDFSQVEADSRQLDINEPFALYYREKRPFFVEGLDFFNTLMDVLHTRTMRDPAWGIKLTGKEGANTLGAYLVEDELTNLIFPGNQSSRSTSLSSNSTAAVLRYKRDFGARYTVGALATDREGTDYHNRVFGMDSVLRISDVDQFTFQALGSSTKYPTSVAAEFGQPLDAFNDFAFSFEYDHVTRSFGWWADYEEIGPNFRADLGYMPQVGYRNVEGGLNYTWIAQEDTWWNNVSIGNQLNYFDDREGNLLRGNAEVWFRFNGTMQSYAYAEFSRSRAAYNGEEFDLSVFNFSARAVPTATITTSFVFAFGDVIDYSNTRLGGGIHIVPSIDVNLGRRLKLSMSHIYERIESNEQHLYTANVSQLTSYYHFNTRMFFRAILQYVDYGYNVNNYILPREPEFRQLFSQLLFSYKLNPRTVLFLGYSDNYYGNQEFSLSQNDRTFFIKLGYAWVL